MNVARLTGAAVISRDQCALTAGVKDVWVDRARRDVTTFAAAYGIHFAAARAGLLALHANGAVVLLRAAYLIREVLCGGNMIKLRRGKIFRGPGRAATDRDICAAVIAINHALRIVRIDPKIMIVTMWHAQRSIGFAAIC